MSLPEARHVSPTAGQPVTVMIAGTDGPVAARVRPLTGDDEMRLDMRSTAMPILREADVLDLVVAEIGGVPPQAATLDELTLGDRTRLLLAALVASYGAPVALLLHCETDGCDQTYELPLDVPALLAGQSAQEGQFVMQCEHMDIQIRLPTGVDMVALAQDALATPQAFFARCAPQAPSHLWDSIAAEMARRDPFAEVVFATTCEACGAQTRGLLDPLALFTNAMASYGGIMAELDRLARTYGWTDAQLGAMTAHRRRLYLAALEAADLDNAGRGLS